MDTTYLVLVTIFALLMIGSTVGTVIANLRRRRMRQK
jgi:hypothetical protein